MSQNDKLLIEKGLPVLNKAQKDKLRGEWQSQTWDDMILSLNSYGKYIMLRPTGFGKTYTCACACNIGCRNKEKEKKFRITLQPDEILLNNGTIVKNKKLCDIKHKKIIFVYVSDILKQVFESYDKATNSKGIIPTDSNGNSRVIYETYNMVAGHWNDKNYLENTLDINNVGLVIFDEVQRMGAERTAEALDIAIPILEELGIYYIGATATVERTTGFDVCDKYFTYKHQNGKITHCWGEHIYTLGDCFRNGLIIPPEYQYIDEDVDKIKKIRQTRLSILQELKAKDANNTNENADIETMKQLQSAVIKNSSKIVHDTMLTLYDCGKKYINNNEELEPVKEGQYKRPNKLPKYMRFLVFTPDRKSMTEIAKNEDAGLVFGGMVKTTLKDFKEAFGRYGYRVRYTVISSYNKEEHDAVKYIDAKHIKSENDVESEKAIVPTDMVIDLIFSINMLNVGYHVEHITGLILKRWTGSNQIFYQQLGRSLSSVSDNIPVVFDFVKSIDSRGINAPLFTKDNASNKNTEYADGTNTIVYSNKNKSSKNSESDTNYAMDCNGDPVDPRKCNTLEAQYITVGMTSASIYEIEQRCNVYLDRETSKKLFNTAYELYMSKIVVFNNNLKSDVRTIMVLYEALRQSVIKQYKLQDTKNVTLNFKAFIEYLRSKQADLYIEYGMLNSYVNNTIKGTPYGFIEHEINSILAIAKTKNNNYGATIKLLLNKNDINGFKQNKEVMKLLHSKCFNIYSDIVMYTK